MDKGEIRAQEITAQVRREIYIMRCLKHRHIVRLIEVLTSDTKLYIVMELVIGGELFDRIEKGRVSEDTARQYFQQLIDGVDFCHKKGVAHRDLKPENLLLDENGAIKITDFGFSSMKGMDVNTGLLYTQCGTPDYCAPEIINNAQRGYTGAKVDAWSCGIILYALLCGRLPFQEHDTERLYDLILACQVKYPESISPGARDLLQNLLVRDPNNRYDLQKVKRHPWFLVNYEGDDAKLLKKRPFFNKKNTKELSESVPSSPGVQLSSSTEPTASAQSDPATQRNNPVREPAPDTNPQSSYASVEAIQRSSSPQSGPSSPVLASPREIRGTTDDGPASVHTSHPSRPTSEMSSFQTSLSLFSGNGPAVEARPPYTSGANDSAYRSTTMEQFSNGNGDVSVNQQTSYNVDQTTQDPPPPRSLPSGAITSSAVSRGREDTYAKYRPASPAVELAAHARAPTPPAHDVFTKVEDRPATPARRQTTATVAAAFKAAVASSRQSEVLPASHVPQPPTYPNVMTNGISLQDSSTAGTVPTENGEGSTETGPFGVDEDARNGDESSSEHDSIEDYENKPAPLLEMPAHPRQLLRQSKEGRRQIHSLPHAQQIRQRSDLAAAAITTGSTGSPTGISRTNGIDQGSASLSTIHRRRVYGRDGSAALINDPRPQRLSRPSDQSSTPPVVYSQSPMESNSLERFRSVSPGFTSHRPASLSEENTNGHGSSSSAAWQVPNSFGYSSKEESTPSSGGWHAEMFSRRLWNMVTKLRGTSEPASGKLSRELRRDLQVLVNELNQLNKGEAWTVLTSFLSLFENLGLGEASGSTTTYGSAITARLDDEKTDHASRVANSHGRSLQPDVSSEEESISLSPVVIDTSGPQSSDLARRRDMSDLLNRWIKTADKRVEDGADGEDSSQFVDLMELQRLMRKHHSGREESNLADDLLRLMNASDDGSSIPFSTLGSQPGQSPPPPHVQSTRSADSYTQPRYLSNMSASAVITRPPIQTRSVSNNNAPLPSDYVPGRLQESNNVSPRHGHDRISRIGGRNGAETSADDFDTDSMVRSNPSHMANSMGMHDVPYYMSDKKSGMATKLKGVLQTMKAKNHRLGEYYAQFKSGLPPDEIMRLIGRVLQDMGAKVTIKRETKRKMKCQLTVSPNMILHAGIELVDGEDELTSVSFRRSKADKGKTDTESFHKFFERVRTRFVEEANAQYPSMRLATSNAPSRRRRRQEEGSRHASDTAQSSISGS